MRGATLGVLHLIRQLRAVSIHAPHARGDCVRHHPFRIPLLFQSTPLMRGATGRIDVISDNAVVSIHAPHARGDLRLLKLRHHRLVSIHAPHARGDLMGFHLKSPLPVFQSTPLMRGATSRRRTGSRAAGRFNPRPSCEGRLSRLTNVPFTRRFNPRPSCEGRLTRTFPTSGTSRFNPRPSCEGRPRS